MKAVLTLLVVVAVGISGCRKVPSAQPVAEGKNPVEAKTQAMPVSKKPDPDPPQRAIDRTAQVIVIGYHRFVEKVRRPDTEITPADFEEQMQALRDDGISVISLKQFLAWRRGEENIPPRSAILTIDDGYDSVYDVAWPILKKFDYPFALFIYTDYVKGGPKSGGASLTWEQLAEMRDAGVSIQSHTVSHSDLRGSRSRKKGADYETWLWNELHGSKEMLEQKLGIKVTSLAVPYGRYDEHVQEIAGKAGYEVLFTVYGQKLTADSPANALGRYMIQSNEPKIFASAVTFEGGGAGGGVHGAIGAISTPLLVPHPEDGSTIADPQPPIRASLASLGEIEAGSTYVRMSGVGLLAAEYDPATGIITGRLNSPLEPDAYTVIVSARAAGRKHEGRWSFTVAPGTPTALATETRRPPGIEGAR